LINSRHCGLLAFVATQRALAIVENSGTEPYATDVSQLEIAKAETFGTLPCFLKHDNDLMELVPGAVGL
jgi:hypothetical protein